MDEFNLEAQKRSRSEARTALQVELQQTTHRFIRRMHGQSHELPAPAEDAIREIGRLLGDTAWRIASQTEVTEEFPTSKALLHHEISLASKEAVEVFLSLSGSGPTPIQSIQPEDPDQKH